MIDARELIDFIRQSNLIEGLVYEPTAWEIEAHQGFLDLDTIKVEDLEKFVRIVARKGLRHNPGMDVRVGDHRPPRGGPEIRRRLESLLLYIENEDIDPYEAHLAYESLHPFMDGNGRSGRVLWWWMVRRLAERALPSGSFLHAFYYQALQGSRRVEELQEAVDDYRGGLDSCTEQLQAMIDAELARHRSTPKEQLHVRETEEIHADPFAGPILSALHEIDMGARFAGKDYHETAEMVAMDVRRALAQPLLRAELVPTPEVEEKKPAEHVCGLHGYDPMKDPPCPGCAVTPPK